MTTRKRQTTTSEVQENVVKEVSTSEVEVVTLTLEDYLSQAKVNEGLIASFKYEGRYMPSMLEPKSVDGWAQAFEAQSRKVYE